MNSIFSSIQSWLPFSAATKKNDFCFIIYILVCRDLTQKESQQLLSDRAQKLVTIPWYPSPAHRYEKDTFLPLWGWSFHSSWCWSSHCSDRYPSLQFDCNKLKARNKLKLTNIFLEKHVSGYFWEERNTCLGKWTALQLYCSHRLISETLPLANFWSWESFKHSSNSSCIAVKAKPAEISKTTTSAIPEPLQDASTQSSPWNRAFSIQPVDTS